MSGEIKDVFISHVHEDDEALQHLKNLAQKSGLKIRDASIDSSSPNDASNPEYIKSEILAPGIKWASTLLVLVSPDTHESEWVEWEIEYAQKQGKRIVGVWARGAKDSDLPKNLDRYASAVVGWDSDSVVDAITGCSNEWRETDGSEPPQRNIRRITCQ